MSAVWTQVESKVLHILDENVLRGPSILEDFVNSEQTRLVGISLALYTAAYWLMFTIFSATWPTFQKLSKGDQVEWVTRINSNVNAMISVVGSITLLRSESNVWTSLVTGNDRCDPLFCVFLGYMLYDLFAVLWNARHLRNTAGSIAHHVVAAGSCLVALWSKILYLFGLFFLLTEFSTPFINNHWFIKSLNWTQGALYYLNGFSGMFFFFLFRIAGQIYLLTYLYSLWDDMARLPLHLSGYFVANLVVLIFLNSYWFTKMVQIAVGGGPKKKKSS
eukprot:TRINITY_DN1816_c0_g1_i1.p1 TRINITY_DN1816_c0_g1~~TRINITY_DN1816_c0_g1_i1.p1  ORF type:complete len:276 (+),score=49.04 TRINITY_DN1816_c0_g1_i1:48-875(+)